MTERLMRNPTVNYKIGDTLIYNEVPVTVVAKRTDDWATFSHVFYKIRYTDRSISEWIEEIFMPQKERT